MFYLSSGVAAPLALIAVLLTVHDQGDPVPFAALGERSLASTDDDFPAEDTIKDDWIEEANLQDVEAQEAVMGEDAAAEADLPQLSQLVAQVTQELPLPKTKPVAATKSKLKAPPAVRPRTVRLVSQGALQAGGSTKDTSRGIPGGGTDTGGAAAATGNAAAEEKEDTVDAAAATGDAAAQEKEEVKNEIAALSKPKRPKFDVKRVFHPVHEAAHDISASVQALSNGTQEASSDAKNVQKQFYEYDAEVKKLATKLEETDSARENWARRVTQHFESGEEYRLEPFTQYDTVDEKKLKDFQKDIANWKPKPAPEVQIEAAGTNATEVEQANIAR